MLHISLKLIGSLLKFKCELDLDCIPLAKIFILVLFDPEETGGWKILQNELTKRVGIKRGNTFYFFRFFRKK